MAIVDLLIAGLNSIQTLLTRHVDEAVSSVIADMLEQD